MFPTVHGATIWKIYGGIQMTPRPRPLVNLLK